MALGFWSRGDELYITEGGSCVKSLSVSLSLSLSLSPHTHTHTHTHFFVCLYIYLRGQVIKVRGHMRDYRAFL